MIIPMENIPPLRLKIPAIGPRVRNTKKAFKAFMVTAEARPTKNTQYMVTMLDRPSFTLGGKSGRGGSICSRAVSTRIIDSIMA
jgi:hypothetical protein